MTSATRPRPAAAPRRWPRRLALAAVAVAVAAVLASGWLDRTERSLLDLGAPAQVRVVNEAGPLEVVEADGPAVLETTASWLFVGPEVVPSTASSDGTDVRITCPGWSPCRVAARLSVPPGTEVEAVSPHDVVTASRTSGPLTLSSDDGHVALGPVSGPVRVLTGSADVRAAGLRSPDVRIETSSGAVAVSSALVPGSLVVEAGAAPVVLTVPDAAYDLDLRGDPVDDAGLGAARRADGTIRVDADGPVTLVVLEEADDEAADADPRDAAAEDAGRG